MSTELRVPHAPPLDGVAVPLRTLVTTSKPRVAPQPARADPDQRWAAEHGLPVLPAAPVAVADYLMARHTAGVEPATVRSARAAIAKVHQGLRFPQPGRQLPVP